MSNVAKAAGKSQIRQSQAFVDAARELGCDEDEPHFEEALKRVAWHNRHLTERLILSNRNRRDPASEPGFWFVEIAMQAVIDALVARVMGTAGIGS